MIKNSKLFLSCVGLGMASCIGTASATENLVLFKIHDVTPVKNEDGNITSCNIGATFYNRSEAEVSNASLKLVWEDDVVANAINQEERNDREARRANNKRVPRYNTATYTSRDIVMDLRLPVLKPGQQVTLKSKVQTDRCYLLLNDMEIDIQKCTHATKNAPSATSGKNTNNCGNLFRYISPKTPDYYSEFKDVSYQEQDSQDRLEENRQKQGVNKLFKETIDSLNSLSQKLQQTRPSVDEGE